MNELTAQEKQFIVNALRITPIQGNAAEVQQVLTIMQSVITKLTAVEQPVANGEREPVKAG